MKKIIWVDTANKNTISARAEVGRGSHYLMGLREQDIDPIQKWCEEHNCGKRTSFDQFKFRNKKELTMFLLVWG